MCSLPCKLYLLHFQHTKYPRGQCRHEACFGCQSIKDCSLLLVEKAKKGGLGGLQAISAFFCCVVCFGMACWSINRTVVVCLTTYISMHRTRVEFTLGSSFKRFPRSLDWVSLQCKTYLRDILLQRPSHLIPDIDSVLF